MLPCYDELLRQLFEADGLAVLAEGLGVLRLAAVLVQQHAVQRGGLVLILGARSRARGAATCRQRYGVAPRARCGS